MKNEKTEIKADAKHLKIIISGGGTGGHVFPAIAIANAIKKAKPETDIMFVGAKGRLEMEKVPQAGYPIEGLWISGFQRKQLYKNLSFPFKVISSLYRSLKIINRFKPDVAIGVGGYASGPLLYAANLKGIPTLIQEQNSYPGITNKLLAKKADKICVVYDNLGKFFDENKIIITGNPVRDVIVKMEGTKAEALEHFQLQADKKVLFITGGSLGARGINEGIAAHLDKLKERNVQVLWQTGKFYINWAREITKPYSDHVKVMDFVKRMDLAYIAADAIVSRAGGTISELCIVGKPVILMPSPNVAEDHQTANAMNLVNKQAAIMVKDHEAKEKLGDALETVLFDETKRQTLVQNIKQLAIKDSADRIAKEVFKLV